MDKLTPIVIDLNKAKFFAGHSLGEYTALVCSGSLTVERAAYLLYERGKSMQDAVPAGQGAMMAILGVTVSEVEKEINLLPKGEICEIANDNSNEQVVVSGKKNIIKILNENLKKKKKRGIILPVSAPFHCSLMKKAAETMKEKILSTDLSTIKSLAENYKIVEEKVLENKYNANITITFKRNLVSDFFYKKGISYSESEKLQTIVYPILILNSELQVFSNNKFFDEWNTDEDFSNIDFVLPVENLDDISFIKKQNK